MSRVTFTAEINVVDLVDAPMSDVEAYALVAACVTPEVDILNVEVEADE